MKISNLYSFINVRTYKSRRIFFSFSRHLILNGLYKMTFSNFCWQKLDNSTIFNHIKKQGLFDLVSHFLQEIIDTSLLPNDDRLMANITF